MAESVSNKLKDLDDKINACIKDISDMFGGIENLDKNFAVLNTNETSSEFCNVLQILVSLLSDHLGISEYLLPHLDEIRKQNNMKFCDLDLHLLNIIENDVPDLKHKEQILWNNVCFYIKKYSLATVFKTYIPLSSIHNHFNLCQVRNYCISLQNIFVPKDVWENYKNFRLQYMKTYICKCKSNECCLNCYLKLSIQCIYEDHLLCYLGCFHPHIVTQTSILEIYSEIIHKAFSKLLQVINHSIKGNICVPKEIISMLLYSKITYQENYKTCFTCFIQYNLLDEIDSIIYCIQNNIATDTLWNKLFIISVLKITEIIALFEDQINILFNLGKDINFHSHDEDLASLFEGSKLILATESPEESPYHESHHQGSTKQCLSSNQTLFSWNWKLILVENGYITEVQRALQTEVENMIKTTTEREKLLLKTNDWKSLIKNDKKLNFASLTVQTNTLLESVLNTVLVLEKYVPVLSSATGVLQPFKYSFSHTLDTYVIDLLKHLQYISEFEHNINYLYIVMNNALFLKNQLKYYCDIMEGSDVHVNENCMNNVCRSVVKLADDLFESMLNLHFKYVSCGILFDSDCYNFQDSKPFFEGERISYTIQMWKMYMKGLYHDVIYFLPQNLAQELYGKVLAFSLDHFLMHYSKSSASEARYPQILQDIYTILLCTTELIYPACSNVSEVIGKKEEFNETKIASIVSKIHSNCCCLLSVLVVLTSPVSDLYTVFKDGFPQPRLSIWSKYECLSPWLPWIRRELFSNFGQSKIMSNVSVWLAVRACTTYKVPLPNAIIQAFTEHHCTLSILLMMQVASLDEEDIIENVLIEENKIKLAYSLSVLILCYDNCSYLLDVFLPVIEKTNSWEEFDVSSISNVLSERSWWYVGLYRALKPFLQSTLEEMTSFWYELKEKSSDIVSLKQWMNFRDEIKKHVVCVCQNNSMNSFNENFSFTSEVISFLCLEKILEKLYDNLIFLPDPFKYTMICLDAHVVNYMPEIHPARNSVCIQFLLSSVITYLNEQEFIDKLPVSIRDMPTITSDALDALCRKEDIFYKNIHYEKKLTKLLTLIKEEFDSQKNNFDIKSKATNFDEIQDDILILTAKKIVEIPKGISIILYLHQLLCTNKFWIQSNLGIPDMLSSDVVLNPISPSPLLRSSLDSPNTNKELKPNLQTSNLAATRYSSNAMINQGESFDSDGSMEHTFTIPQEMLHLPDDSGTHKFKFSLLVNGNISSPVYNFNPLQHFDTLGASTFAKVAAERPQLPWEALLSHLPILGITEINFQILFSQRWDVISDIMSSTEEMRQIEELKNLYKYDEK